MVSLVTTVKGPTEECIGLDFDNQKDQVSLKRERYRRSPRSPQIHLDH